MTLYINLIDISKVGNVKSDIISRQNTEVYPVIMTKYHYDIISQ